MKIPRQYERGFIMAVALFALVALSIAGATSVMLASSDLDIIGNERRRHQVQACAESGVEAGIAGLPDTSWASNPPSRPTNPSAKPSAYAKGLYYSGDGNIARAEHLSVTGPNGEVYTSGNSAKRLPPESVSAFVGAGANVANMPIGGNANGAGVAGILGSGVYRVVSTCKNAQGTVAQEMESVVLFGAQR